MVSLFLVFCGRLNYPLKLRNWHHACASWNGKTGEWQLWVKAERVGRGFHNRVCRPNSVFGMNRRYLHNSAQVHILLRKKTFTVDYNYRFVLFTFFLSYYSNQE